MIFSGVKAITIPEGKVKKITAGGAVLWKSGYKNWVKFSTEADGVTIYNGGLGYKNEYRVRSGGAEGWDETGSCTGFISAKSGNIVRLSGYNIKETKVTNAINAYNSNHSHLGQIVANNTGSYGVFNSTGINWDDVVLEKDGVYKWVIPDGYSVAYIRVTGYTLGDGSKMIVTIDEEINEGGGTTTGYAWANTGYAFVPADYEDRIVDLENEVGDLKEVVNSGVAIVDKSTMFISPRW